MSDLLLGAAVARVTQMVKHVREWVFAEVPFKEKGPPLKIEPKDLGWFDEVKRRSDWKVRSVTLNVEVSSGGKTEVTVFKYDDTLLAFESHQKRSFVEHGDSVNLLAHVITIVAKPEA